MRLLLLRLRLRLRLWLRLADAALAAESEGVLAKGHARDWREEIVLLTLLRDGNAWVPRRSTHVPRGLASPHGRLRRAGHLRIVAQLGEFAANWSVRVRTSN